MGLSVTVSRGFISSLGSQPSPRVRNIRAQTNRKKGIAHLSTKKRVEIQEREMRFAVGEAPGAFRGKVTYVKILRRSRFLLLDDDVAVLRTQLDLRSERVC